MTNHTERESVCAFVLGPDVVNFGWNNGESCAQTAVWAQGYMRGSQLFLRMCDDDCDVNLVCKVTSVHVRGGAGPGFRITAAHGLHRGLTLSEDRVIDSNMLLHDARLRRAKRNEGWAGRVETSTHFECIHVVSLMLRTLRPWSSVVFDDLPADAGSRPILTSIVGTHITLLMEGDTHAVSGVKRMVYM